MPQDIQKLNGVQKPRALLMDLDGTLLEQYGSEIRPADRELLFAIKQHIPVSIASGRYQEGVRQIASMLKLTTPQISENGARIFDMASGKTIHQTSIPAPISKQIIEYVAKPLKDKRGPQHFYICANGRTIHNEQEMQPADYENVTAVTTVVNSRAEGNAIMEQIRAQFGIAAEMSCGIFNAKEQLYAVFMYENKGQAARKLAKILDVPVDAMVVIGDGLNDISMFNVTKLSIAMGNAVDDVKRHADYTTLPQAEGGFALALQQVLKLLNQ